MKFFDWVLNKVGVIRKLIARVYWDLILSRSAFYFAEDIPPVSSAAYKSQSVDYLLLIEAFKLVPFNSFSGVRIADVGCGAGRLLAYLNYINARNFYVGYELNLDLAESARKLFQNNKNIQIKSGNVLNERCEHDFYVLFNPFPSDVFIQFLNLIEGFGPISIMYINASAAHVDVAGLYSSRYYIECTVLNKPISSIMRTNVLILNSK
jgi:SAM-dependent methyltransferase